MIGVKDESSIYTQIIDDVILARVVTSFKTTCSDWRSVISIDPLNKLHLLLLLSLNKMIEQKIEPQC